MSSVSIEYFASEDAKKVKNWEIVEQHRVAKADLARLRNELDQHASHWRELADVSDIRNTFVVAEANIKVEVPVLRGSERDGCKSNQIAHVPLRYFDSEQIKRLFADIERAKKREAELATQVRELGINL